MHIFLITIDIFVYLNPKIMLQTGEKKEAEKLVKNIIKIIVKVGILARNDQFTAEDMGHATQVGGGIWVFPS